MDIKSQGSIRGAVVVPFLQALATGLLAGMVVLLLCVIGRNDQAGTIALLAGLIVAFLSWFSFRSRWQSVYEAMVHVDLSPDDITQESEPDPERIRIDVVNLDETQSDFLDLPATKEQLIDLAEGLQRGTPFTVGAWSGSRRPFSRSQFEALRGELLARGYIRWQNGRHHAQGIELTAKGRAVMRGLFEIDQHPANDDPGPGWEKLP